jgi:hypothetical protein
VLRTTGEVKSVEKNRESDLQLFIRHFDIIVEASVLIGQCFHVDRERSPHGIKRASTGPPSLATHTAQSLISHVRFCVLRKASGV